MCVLCICMCILFHSNFSKYHLALKTIKYVVCMYGRASNLKRLALHVSGTSTHICYTFLHFLEDLSHLDFFHFFSPCRATVNLFSQFIPVSWAFYKALWEEVVLIQCLKICLQYSNEIIFLTITGKYTYLLLLPDKL